MHFSHCLLQHKKTVEGWMSVCTFCCSLSEHPFREQRLGGVKQEDGGDMREKVKGSGEEAGAHMGKK